MGRYTGYVAKTGLDLVLIKMELTYVSYYTSIKYKVKRDKPYLPYIELGRWFCSHFQLETPLNFHKPITKKLYNIEQ